MYNWQFVNCLRVWARLLALKGGKGQDLEQVRVPVHSFQHPPLRLAYLALQLLYPFIHLVLGVIRLQPTPRFYPLRFICLRFLVEVHTYAFALLYVDLTSLCSLRKPPVCSFLLHHTCLRCWSGLDLPKDPSPGHRSPVQ